MSNTTHSPYEWAEFAGYLPALSIQQPFAEALLNGTKSIELRSWKPRYRGLVVLHTGSRWYGQEGTTAAAAADSLADARITATRLGLPGDVAVFPRSALVGLARLSKCAVFTREGWERLRDAHQHNGSWDADLIGWQFSEIQRFASPIPYLGSRGLFPVPTTALPGSDTTNQRTRVVHCQQEAYDVYIGRPGKWGNPVHLKAEAARESTITAYRTWIQDQPSLLADLHELRGKRLGCWCKDSERDVPCHGDVLAELADALTPSALHHPSTIYVDDLVDWGWQKGKSCHMSVDDHSSTGLAALHTFAATIGLQRRWFQDHALMPHYDLTAGKRQQALAQGATGIACTELYRRCSRAAVAGNEGSEP